MSNIKKIVSKNKLGLKELCVEFFKFGIVGFINTVLSYAINNIGFYILGLHTQVCNGIAFVITVFISYMLNNYFVFVNKNEEKKPFIRSLIKAYISYSFTGLFLTGFLLYIEEEFWGIPHYVATLANLVVTVPINFVLNKFWTFKS